MIYGFEPANDRRISSAYHNYHMVPEIHPSRTMPEHDIFYIVDGHFSLRIEKEDFDFEKGDVAVLPALHPHYGTRYCMINSHTIFIHFSRKDGDKKLYDEVREKEHDHLYIIPSKIKPVNPMIAQYFYEIQRMFCSKMPHWEIRCEALLNLILGELNDDFVKKSGKQDKLISDLISYIDLHPERFFSIKELAEMACISPRTIVSRFKRAAHASVHQYQMDKKLDQIAALLYSERYNSLKNLAANFGFSDEFHLSVAFKKKFSVSPKFYKKVNALP
jgi:AraC-like DNA-binding protein